MRLQLRLIEQLTPEEQAAAMRDLGHSRAALQDVFLYHAGVKWRALEQVYPSHVRNGHVALAPVTPSKFGAAKVLDVVVVADDGAGEEAFRTPMDKAVGR